MKNTNNSPSQSCREWFSRAVASDFSESSSVFWIFLKTKKTFTTIALIFTVIFCACAKKTEEEEPEDENEIFFYYDFDEKVFLQQRKDMIYLKFVSEAAKATKEQLLAIIASDNSLQPTTFMFLDESRLRFAVLESKNGKPIPLSAIESFKAKPEIISVEYMYQIEKDLIGITDEFVVKLEQTTSYEQFQDLADQYDSTIGEENRYRKNVFMLYVSKASKLNAMQLANLFYETGLFEYTAPELVIVNALRPIN